MTALPAYAPAPPVWFLQVYQCAHLDPPSTYFYLLVDVSRTLPIAATLSAGPLGAGFGAWLVAATVGRLPPATLQWVGAVPDADLPGLRDWLQARPVCLMRLGWHASLKRGVPPPLEDPVEALCRSALRAVDTHRGAGRLAFQAAQQRLDLWYRSYGGR